MSDEQLSLKIFNQTTENIQKLFDLSVRIDERVKSLTINKEELRLDINTLKGQFASIEKELALFEKGVAGSDTTLGEQIQHCQTALIEIDKKIDAMPDLVKRLELVEMSIQGSNSRWEKITSFFIQLAWVILAAWLLAKFGLDAPP